MSDASLRTAGILLVGYPTVVFGCTSILWHWITRHTNYYDHPLRRDLWRAGHAHAGDLLACRSSPSNSSTTPTSLRLEAGRAHHLPAAALLLPIAFFLSIAGPAADQPNRLINLASLGALSLSVGMLTLGIGLLRI